MASLNANLQDPADFTLRIDGYEWQLHSSVLVAASKFFEKACNGVFKESIEKSITLHDDCPWIVARMIQWLYSGYVSSISSPPPKGATLPPSLNSLMKQNAGSPEYTALKSIDTKRRPWQIKVLMYRIADKYAIPGLLQDSRQWLQDSLYKFPDNFEAIVDYLGVSIMQRDGTLCRMLFKAVFEKRSDPRDLYVHINDIFDGEPRIKSALSEVFLDTVEHYQKHNQDLEASIREAQEALECVSGQIERLWIDRDSCKRSLTQLGDALTGKQAKTVRVA